MSIDRRTFMRLAAAGLSSAALHLTACVKEQELRATRHWPTPDAPLTPTMDWYYVALQEAYQADLENYRLHVAGQVRHKQTLTLDEIKSRFEEVVLPVTLACVGGRPSGGLQSSSCFRGVRMLDVMEAAGVADRATAAVIHALEGYVAIRSLQDFRRPETLLAYEMGVRPEATEPLPVDHGFPLRLLTPGIYGWVQPKWISSITFVDESNHFEVIRHASDLAAGKMQLSSGFSWPREGFAIPSGVNDVLGYAFGDSRLISRVEVQVDDEPWEDADIVWNDADDTLPTSVWVLWRYTWDAPVGDHVLGVRATYADGERQITGRAFPYSGGSLATVAVRVFGQTS